ncbi:hypothetical protein M426DRAFT_213832 [Hypoxylon sp. CI-4A]|nr:hypothetical protein M426DRAFT_213832 [Hypoxylon sp. CI-4A]
MTTLNLFNHCTYDPRYPTSQASRRLEAQIDTTRARALSRERAHSRSTSLHNQDGPTNAPLQGHARHNSSSSFRNHEQLGKQSSPERGRSLRKYEFPWTDSDKALSAVPESAVDKHFSRVTTMTDVIEGANEERPRSRSMSRHKSPPKPAEPLYIQKADKHRPQPLDINDARNYYSAVRAHSNLRPHHIPMTPSEAEMALAHALDDPNSSVYTDGTPLYSYDEPLGSPFHLPRDSQLKIDILQGYNNWKDSQEAAAAMEANGEKQVSEDVSLSKDDAEASIAHKSIKEFEQPPFTPLTPWLVSSNVILKRKTLIGDNGWLENTAAQVLPPEPKKNTGFFDSVKKTARKLVSTRDLP